ncbi:uroporphyrinogen decarboxylase family protein [Alkalibacter mobilis]|uniref:uroporphyrinogen decarboxylase family protein n=1 Tax=Alkalibacter mobilis TaxID=2787712 RepID=UPI00189C7D0C|nr:uroporphyrinogen decarboxylase family protein [Alkalibacter mobilis]MBF7095912.1 hypothetical protein [Alkalibacter mobilis]
MNEEVKKLQEERIQIHTDFYNNKIPKRMPTSFMVPAHIAAEHYGLDVFEYQYDFSKLDAPVRKICDEIYSDGPPVTPANQIFNRLPSFYQLLDSQSFVMGTDGFVQHPEVVGMMEDEYPQLIEDPYAFIVERVMPRQYKNLDTSNTAKSIIAMQRARLSMDEDFNASLPWFMGIMQDYGYYPGGPLGSSGFCEAPYDFIADQLRSFSGISMDIRRHRSELIEACEAVLPMMFKMGKPAFAHPLGSVMTPLHMPTFMREKDFMEVWMPSYKKMFEQYAALGIRGGAFCEDDWMRYLDNLLELPSGMILMFEYGDPQKIKDKLGKKFIIQGLYPVNLLKSGTKQQVLDKAKEILDIMLPGGGYIFGFDKNPLTLGDVNMENWAALSHFVKDYAVYDNPGENFGTPVNSEGFVFEEEKMTLKSRYLFDWDEFKKKYPNTPESVRDRFQRHDDNIFALYMNMMI